MAFYISFLKWQSSDYPVRYRTILRFKPVYCDFNLKCDLRRAGPRNVFAKMTHTKGHT